MKLSDLPVCFDLLYILLWILFQDSPKDENSLIKAVQNVHEMIDKEIAAGTNPNNVFVCGFSQGGLSLSLSLYLLFDY